MSNSTLTVPSKIKVGYQNREDTYTKRLAYVIYQDSKKVWRKEGSWESWRDKSIDPVFFDNVPTSGFVLNKGVTRWQSERAYVRVWDPRDFEFEISIPNLLFLHSECDFYKGKGIDAELVYAWDGKDLVLLPVKSKEYADSVRYTEIQSSHVPSKELVAGYTYIDKNLNELLFLGKIKTNAYDKYFLDKTAKYRHYRDNPTSEDHKILTGTYSRNVFYRNGRYEVLTSVNSIKELKSTVVPDNFADLIIEFDKTEYMGKDIRVVAEPISNKEAMLELLNNEIKNRAASTYYFYDSHALISGYFRNENAEYLKVVIGCSSYGNIWMHRGNTWMQGSAMTSYEQERYLKSDAIYVHPQDSYGYPSYININELTITTKTPTYNDRERFIDKLKFKNLKQSCSMANIGSVLDHLYQVSLRVGDIEYDLLSLVRGEHKEVKK